MPLLTTVLQLVPVMVVVKVVVVVAVLKPPEVAPVLLPRSQTALVMVDLREVGVVTARTTLAPTRRAVEARPTPVRLVARARPVHPQEGDLAGEMAAVAVPVIRT